MAQRIEGTAFARIEKFEDNKSEQVWELFQNEFMRAVISADGETALTEELSVDLPLLRTLLEERERVLLRTQQKKGSAASSCSSEVASGSSAKVLYAQTGDTGDTGDGARQSRIP